MRSNLACAELIREPGACGPRASALVHSATSPAAQALYRMRRSRDRLFAEGLFSEPGWDLLLDLFVAEKESKRISITSACIASAAPTTTALRCLKQMERAGLLYREADVKDGRKVYVRLSSGTMERLDKLLSDLCRGVVLMSSSTTNTYQHGSCCYPNS